MNNWTDSQMVAEIFRLRQALADAQYEIENTKREVPSDRVVSMMENMFDLLGKEVSSLRKEVERLEAANTSLWWDKEALEYDLANAKSGRRFWRDKYKAMRSQAKVVQGYLWCMSSDAWYVRAAKTCMKNLFKI